MLRPKAWYQDHHQLHWAKLPDESLCRAYIQFTLVKMCHQQEAMNILLQGVAEGFVIQGLLVGGHPLRIIAPLSNAKMTLNPNLQLTTRDQLFEDDTLLESMDAEDVMSDWSHGAEECCLRWKSALANFFSKGTQVSRA